MNRARAELLIEPQQAKAAEVVAGRIVAIALTVGCILIASAAIASKLALDRLESRRDARDDRGVVARLWALATTPSRPAAGPADASHDAAYYRCIVFHGGERNGGRRGVWVENHCRKKYRDR